MPGTFTYTPAAGTVLKAGNGQTLSVTFTPTDTTDYTTATATAIDQRPAGDADDHLGQPRAITYGTALSGTQLDATSSWTVGGVNGSVAGTFTYTPAAGTVLGVGNNQTLSVTFTPTDTTDFTSATATVTINVMRRPRLGDVPQAGHDDAGQLDRYLWHAGLRRHQQRDQPPLLRHRHAQRPGDATPGRQHHRPPRPPEPRRHQPHRRHLVRVHQLHGGRDLTDGQSHDLELYFLDWDSTARSEQVQISNAATGAVLDTETVSSFHCGVYLNWQVSGNVVITITKLAGANAVLSGLFFDPTSTSATFLKQDTTTRRQLDQYLRHAGL